MVPNKNHDDDQTESNPVLAKRTKVQLRTSGSVSLMRDMNQSLLRNARARDKAATRELGDSSKGSTKFGQSATQVFGTTELLEKILVDVGNVKDLVRMRGVGRKWQDVIEGSLSLKGPLFLAPEQADHEWHSYRVTLPYDQYSVPSPLDDRSLAKRPRGSIIAPPMSSETLPTVVFKSAQINPLLLFKDPKHAEIPIWRPKYINRRTPYDWTSQERYLRKEARPRHIKTKSMLMEMFATQPPVSEMILRTYNSNHDLAARKIRNHRGVRVIDVLRAAGEVTGRKAIVVDNVFFPPETTGDRVTAKFHREQEFWARC